METTPMNYAVEMPMAEWFHHPLVSEWLHVPEIGYRNFLNQKYNIHVIHGYEKNKPGGSFGVVEFESTQDYILWKLHQ